MFKTNIRYIYGSRPFKIINYCKYYKLEDNLEILSFNKRFSNPKLRWVLRKKYNYTKRFLYAIFERIKNNSNVIIVIFGTPNSGKSEGAQTIAFFIRYCLWKMGKKVKIHLAFSTSDFQIILIDMDVGDIGIRDESSKESGIGSKNVQKYLDNITKAIRQDQNSFIFVDPTLIEPDVVYYFLETAGKNYKKRNIRFILYDKNKEILGHIYLPLHWCERYREKYKEKKNANLDDLKANAGMVTPEINSERLERDTNILMRLCNKNSVERKGEIQGLIVKYNSKQERKKDMIKGDSNYMSTLISIIYGEIRKNKEKQYIEKEQEEISKIKSEKGDDFAEFCLNNIIDKTKAKIAHGLVRGDSLRNIDLNYRNIHYSKIQNISKDLRRLNNPENLGFLFEKWYALHLGVPKEKLDEVLGGASNKPDLIWDGVVYSLKFRLDLKAKSLKFKQSVDLAPEYKYAKEHEINYNLVFMNPAWDQRIQVININPNKNSKDIIVKKVKKRKEK